MIEKKDVTVDLILGKGGALEGALPNYEHRPEQLAIAKAVEKVFTLEGQLVAEAGTGTGKTLAYLVPAILSGKKVIVSTATKNLQDQVYFKDIPLLQKDVGLEFKAAYVKGRQNYLCLKRFDAFEKSPTFHSKEEAQSWPDIVKWASQTQSGDRAELQVADGFGAWPDISSTSDNCVGQKCHFYDSCFVVRTRKRAEEAEVVVVNHHLFFADLSLKMQQSDDYAEGVLPQYDAVIFDEAHGLEDVATDYFGLQFSNWRVSDLIVDAERILAGDDKRASMLGGLTQRLTQLSDEFFKNIPKAMGIWGEEGTKPLTPNSLRPLDAFSSSLIESLSALTALCSGAASDELEGDLRALVRRSGELSAAIDFIRRAADPKFVFWLEMRSRGFFLKAAPLDVSEQLKKHLYPKISILVFTSATLTVEGRFDFFLRRLGLVTPTEVKVDSPFNYEKQCALYIPRHLPEPNAPGYIEAATEEIIALINANGGSALLLFTSLRNMEKAHALSRSRLAFPVYLQGQAPKHALLQRLQIEPSVLFATQSFWEGIDVPGDALTLVVIDRLPFASPGNPLIAARLEHLRDLGEEPFSAYQLPAAALSLRQGFGRLIRTRKDRGIVAVLDKRIWSKSYGQVFLKSLPRTPQFAHRSDLQFAPHPPVAL